jgi:adiponectin receptor
MNHSEKVASFGVQLDYLGILLLMWGATILMIYYALQCDQRLQMIYWIVVCYVLPFPPPKLPLTRACLQLSVFGAGCSIAALTPSFRAPMPNPCAPAPLPVLSLRPSSPSFTASSTFGESNTTASVYYLLGMLEFDATGAIAYATKFPEQFWRRTFDLFGGSHQIMHIMVDWCGGRTFLWNVEGFRSFAGAPLVCRP